MTKYKVEYSNIRDQIKKALNRINPMKGASKEKLTQTKLSILKTIIINQSKNASYEYSGRLKDYEYELKWAWADDYCNYEKQEKELEYYRGRKEALKELELLIIEMDRDASKVKKK